MKHDDLLYYVSIDGSYIMEMHQQHVYREYPYTNGKSNTASIILYTVLSFILSLFYFIVVIVSLSLGIGTLVIWIGLPILLLTFGVIGGIAAIERSIVSSLLGVDIPSPRATLDPHKSWWRRSVSTLRDPLTWKSLLYILFKFPLSVCTFSIMISFVATSIALLLAPLGYLIATYVLMLNGIHTQPETFTILGWEGVSNIFNVAVTGTFDPIMFFKSFAWTLVGIVFWLLTRYVLQGLGWISAEFARVMLTPISASAEDGSRGVQYTYQYRPE
jgi:Putative sensor